MHLFPQGMFNYKPLGDPAIMKQSLSFLIGIFAVAAACAQADSVKPMMGKTLTVQGQSTAFVRVTLNSDGSFIQCTPGFSCEVMGTYKVADDGKVSATYRTLFFDRNSLVRQVTVRDGPVNATSFLGRNILKIEESPLVALSGESLRNFLVGKLDGVFADGSVFNFTINADGTFEECTKGACDTGTWKIEDKFWVAKHKSWSPPSRYPDGYVRFPVVKISDNLYQFAGLEVKK